MGLISNNWKSSTKQSHSGSMIRSTIQGIKDAAETNPPKVLDANTFMTAFSDYVKNVSDPEARHGVPCGMELKSWSKLGVRTLCGRKWDPFSVNRSGYGSSQTVTGTRGERVAAERTTQAAPADAAPK